MEKIKAKTGDVLLIMQTTLLGSSFEAPKTLSKSAKRGWNETFVIVGEVESNFIRASVNGLPTSGILFDRHTGISFFGRSLIVDNLGQL
jgi:hypothetical protein